MNSEGKQLPMPFILTLLTPCPGILPRTRPPRGRSLSFLNTSALPYTSQIPIKENYRIRFNTCKESQSSENFQAINKHTFELDKHTSSQKQPSLAWSVHPSTRPRNNPNYSNNSPQIPHHHHYSQGFQRNSLQDDVLRLWKLNLQYVVLDLFPSPSPSAPLPQSCSSTRAKHAE
jgi:hypothetical protein